MQQNIAEANESITHAEFASGVQSGTIGFRCMVGEPQQFITGVRKAIFSIFVLLYTLAPPSSFRFGLTTSTTLGF